MKGAIAGSWKKMCGNSLDVRKYNHKKKKPDGTDETLTIDQYKMDIKRMIGSRTRFQNNANMVMQV